MAAYADYSYYSTTYLGTAIPEADFPRLALQSSNFINQVTFGRAASVTDEASMDQIKMACCAVAEAMQLELQGGPLCLRAMTAGPAVMRSPRTRRREGSGSMIPRSCTWGKPI